MACPAPRHQGSALEDAPWVLSPMSLRPCHDWKLTVGIEFGLDRWWYVVMYWWSLMCVKLGNDSFGVTGVAWLFRWRLRRPTKDLKSESMESGRPRKSVSIYCQWRTTLSKFSMEKNGTNHWLCQVDFDFPDRSAEQVDYIGFDCRAGSIKETEIFHDRMLTEKSPFERMMEVGEQFLPRRVLWGLLPEALWPGANSDTKRIQKKG